jgi:cytoskeletal protein RodZ
MNIFGRVLGGILIFISLAWLARIAQVFPFSNSTNQFGAQPTTPRASLTTNPTGQRTGTSTLNAPGAKTSTKNTAIAQNPATAPANGAAGTAGTATGTATAPAATTPQPVTAAW